MTKFEALSRHWSRRTEENWQKTQTRIVSLRSEASNLVNSKLECCPHCIRNLYPY